ncbi:MAG TPA: hypothetical protein VL362_01720 [Patescibacteria group bacterium]|nr:hypothetical protein [Patescibacteria group bacterium]
MEKQPTFNQINQQLERNQPASVLVERSNKQITVGTYEGLSPDRPGKYRVKVGVNEAGEDLIRDLSPAELDDEHQASLAETLGTDERPRVTRAIGAEAFQAASIVERDEDGLIVMPESIRNPVVPATEAAPQPKTQEQRVHELNERVDTLTANLSPEDVQRLYRYSLYKDDKAEAQRSGDGYASEQSGQYMGQEYRAMSPEAQQVADTYHELTRHLQWLRDSMEN